MYFEFMGVILLHSDHQHVSVNYFQDGKKNIKIQLNIIN